MTKPLLKKELCEELLTQIDLRLKETPQDKDLLKMRALLFNLIGKFQESIEEIKKLLEKEDGDVSVLYLLSDSYLNMGDTTEAKRSFWEAHFRERLEPFGEPASAILSDEEKQDIEDVLHHEKQKALLALLNVKGFNHNS